jgi:hypothetical protein
MAYGRTMDFDTRTVSFGKLLYMIVNLCSCRSSKTLLAVFKEMHILRQ